MHKTSGAIKDYCLQVNEESEQEVNIEEIYFHEQFNKGVRLNNDIALVKLKGRGLILGTDAQPICLPPPDIPYLPGLNCTISGWGSTKSGGSGKSGFYYCV
ncbi:hypothetical protein PR048_029233 [Dryococelus australis]|uniref:Peptidase S1 domain-containing protein n=1 Tax=Dryococelus australis TaxID=614101 RepID=A0ABQ9GCT7_9NEOP|nr:hypothetical protein PR048_029233 [Dryococelus australis]